MKALILTFAVLTLIVNISFAQLNTENFFKAPFISAVNSQQSIESIMRNSEKDIVFIENLGQIRDSKGKKRPDVLFLTRSQGVDMYITNSGITYVFRKIESDIKKKSKDLKTSYYRLDMEFVGMNKNIKVKKELDVEQQFNYYTPEYPNGISPKAYRKITIENIYNGIDLVYYEKEGKMKYDFIVKAGANAKIIKMKYKGAGTVYLDEEGNVIITTPMGEIREDKPYTYLRNTGIELESRYEVKNNLVQFDIAEYNNSEDIIIDPYRIWATYYGGSGLDWGNSICSDVSGNIYVTGQTSTNFPTQTLTGAYNQTTSGGGWDAFILKFNSSGARQWATYYGGNGNDIGWSICTDNSGALYVTGETWSSNFPRQTLTGAYNQTTMAGQDDAFILKFNSSCTRTWATYYGGNSNDVGWSICTDNSGNLYLTGETLSSDFPTQVLTGAYNQSVNGGIYDAFVLKFNNIGARIWATYYGGNSGEVGRGIYTDELDYLYVTGSTGSSNFPTQILTGAYNQTYNWGGDAFILKFNSTSERIWATYYGGSNSERGCSIYKDNNGNLYITGYTYSLNFPLQILNGAYNDTTFGGGYLDAFILKFNNFGERLWATYYGGTGNEFGNDLCTDNSGNLFIVGYTDNADLPTQAMTGAYNQPIYGGGDRDAFILMFNDISERTWATYYGGNGDDLGVGSCIDNLDNFYVIGDAGSNDFPIQILSGAYNQTTLGGADDAFILKFSPTPVGIKNILNEIPIKYSLHQNYPNPFNPTTNIRFDIQKTSVTKMIIYNALGREVASLVNEELKVGSYEVRWDGSDCPSGVYIYKLHTGDFVDVKKMVLLK